MKASARARVNWYHSCDPAGGWQEGLLSQVYWKTCPQRKGLWKWSVRPCCSTFSQGWGPRTVQYHFSVCHGFCRTYMALEHSLFINPSVQCHRRVSSTRCLGIVTNTNIFKLKCWHQQELWVPVKIKLLNISKRKFKYLSLDLGWVLVLRRVRVVFSSSNECTLEKNYYLAF